MATSESTSSKDSSLSSSDLVSRFLAATPSYLYSNPPIHQNFFFSEMLRSFLPLKNETIPSNVNRVRRRKRSWKESRDRPIELTINKKNNCQYHTATQTSSFQYEQYYQQPQNNHIKQYPQILEYHQQSLDQQLQNSNAGIQMKKDNNECYDEKFISNNDKQDVNDIMETRDSEIQQKAKLIKKYYLEKSALNSPLDSTTISPDINTPKTNEFQNITSRINYTDDYFLQNNTRTPIDNTASYSKNKSEFNMKNVLSKIAGQSEDTHPRLNFKLQNSITSDFPQSSFWHPQYSLSQTYPSIDPLHLFIDFRVSGHIWDQNSTERNTFSRNKYSSAFDVPQSKEYNRPLNLTRNESTLPRFLDKSTKGPHHILKNIKQTYQRIWTTKCHRNDTSNADFHESIPAKKTQIIPLKIDEINEFLHNRNKKEI